MRSLSNRNDGMHGQPARGESAGLAAATYRRARRVVVFVVGMTLLAVGIAMIVLPGPAVVMIPLGLAVLAAEFAWARRWLWRLKRSAGKLGDYLRKSDDEPKTPSP
jgi:tellurite resistance protein TerC